MPLDEIVGFESDFLRFLNDEYSEAFQELKFKEQITKIFASELKR
jgi:hypothetical protein